MYEDGDYNAGKDLLLCYVYKDYGGAYDMKKHAEKNGTEIINLY